MTGRPGRSRRLAVGTPADAGTATAELAVVLPAFVLLVAAAVGAVGVATVQLRCTDAAAMAARAAARGEPRVVVESLARSAAPAGATVAIVRDGDLVTVTVRAPATPLTMLRLPAVAASSSAPVEPGVGEP